MPLVSIGRSLNYNVHQCRKAWAVFKDTLCSHILAAFTAFPVQLTVHCVCAACAEWREGKASSKSLHFISSLHSLCLTNQSSCGIVGKRVKGWVCYRLKQLLWDRLEECGWRDEVEAHARGENLAGMLADHSWKLWTLLCTVYHCQAQHQRWARLGHIKARCQ